MCGIAGFNWADKNLVRNMTDAIKHRGPDADGHFVAEKVSLGHRRLSIIDLTDNAAQPMQYKHFTIVFNGEIYNFEEIKQTLSLKGHVFNSQSDTEIILHAYEEIGESCVKLFNGMWSFCIYNSQNNSFFLSRDRFGIKPLYYFIDKDRFIFASELKAIKCYSADYKIDKKAINWFFYQKYIGGDTTIYTGVKKLLAGHSATYIDKKFELIQYYNLEIEVNKAKSLPLKRRLETVEGLLVDAVEKRLLADVPVGAFLSGGIDSSLISAIVAKNTHNFQTFSIGFKEKSYDEVSYSKKVAEHISTSHHVDYLEIKEDFIKDVIKNLDEPFGDSSVLPTALLAKITKKYVTVALSGDAGDEIFGGYDTYKAHKIAKFIPSFVLRPINFVVGLLPASDKKVTMLFKLRRFTRNRSKNRVKRHFDWMATYDSKLRKELLGQFFLDDERIVQTQESDNLFDIQVADIHNYMVEDILKKVDIASMQASLEARVPFLDYRLVPIVLSLPDKYKIKHFKTKAYLKEIAGKYLPAEIISRKKRGFSVPVSLWIRESKFIQNTLCEDKYFSHNLLNKSLINNLLTNHLSKKQDNSRQLWLVFVFNYWYSENFSNRK